MKRLKNIKNVIKNFTDNFHQQSFSGESGENNKEMFEEFEKQIPEKIAIPYNKREAVVYWQNQMSSIQNDDRTNFKAEYSERNKAFEFSICECHSKKQNYQIYIENDVLCCAKICSVAILSIPSPDDNFGGLNEEKIKALVNKSQIEIRSVITGEGIIYDHVNNELYIISDWFGSLDYWQAAEKIIPVSKYKKLFEEYTKEEYRQMVEDKFSVSAQYYFSDDTLKKFSLWEENNDLINFMYSLIKKKILKNSLKKNYLILDPVAVLSQFTDYRKVYSKLNSDYMTFYSSDELSKTLTCPCCSLTCETEPDKASHFAGTDYRKGTVCPYCGCKLECKINFSYKLYFELLPDRNILLVVSEPNEINNKIVCICKIEKDRVVYLFGRQYIQDGTNGYLINSDSELIEIFNNSNVSDFNFPEIYKLTSGNSKPLEKISNILLNSDTGYFLNGAIKVNYLSIFLENPIMKEIYRKYGADTAKLAAFSISKKNIKNCLSIKDVFSVSEKVFEKMYELGILKDNKRFNLYTEIFSINRDDDSLEKVFNWIGAHYEDLPRYPYKSIAEIMHYSPILSCEMICDYVDQAQIHQALDAKTILELMGKNILYVIELGKDNSDREIIFPKDLKLQIARERKQILL